MDIRTRRWCSPAEPDDGLKILICRFRPRALPRSEETWDVWMRNLGPSPELLKAFQGKGVTPISLAEYRRRYIAEMESQKETIRQLAERVRAGEKIVLMCSRDCIIEQACHRSVLAGLVASEAAALAV